MKEVDFCFVLPDLLSTTPRAYRVIEHILEQGYSVHLVCGVRRLNAYENHEKIVKILSEKHTSFSVNEVNYADYGITSFIHKVLSKFAFLFFFILPKPLFLRCLSLDWTIIMLYNAVKIKAKIYVGHRPASLPIISKLAQKYKAISWFDIEDEHTHESLSDEWNKVTKVICTYYQANFYTAAAQLIGASYLKNIGSKNKFTVILNSPNGAVENYHNEEKELKIIWFSQTVSFGRGLENAILGVLKSTLPTTFTIIGEWESEFSAWFNKLNVPKHIQIIKTGFVSENEIIQKISEADIGLSTDLSCVDKSRNLAVPNKIVYYSVYGNYLLYTATSGQIQFVENYQLEGTLIENNEEGFEEYFDDFDAAQLQTIRDSRLKRIEHNQVVNWGSQKEELNDFISSMLF